ncbi:MAG: hypothetical protein KC486_28435 [Myxococcales bacterium]|nr:hypothetical protein [Myxococcales bacterium]
MDGRAATTPGWSVASLPLALVLLALMFMVVRHDLEVPPAAPVDAPAEEFSGTRALAALAEVLAD